MVLALALIALSQPSLAELEQLSQKRPGAATYRALASAYERMGEFTKASAAYFEASQRYASLGDLNAARVLSDLGKRYQTVAKIYIDRPSGPPMASAPRARLEPAQGCYLGANIEREDNANGFFDFDQRVGKAHALFFVYRRYGLPFPDRTARELGRLAAGLQIAFEPRNLAEVQDDRYLHDFARAAAESRIPIFLRFASEMNGPWTPYHGDPSAYIEKFRLVSRVMHDEAPNVAMVWCPNEIPETDIKAYYPGPDAVDWVGVNFYSVIYNDADRARGAEWRNPADSLDFVYRNYAARHPMMIGEWAASHRSVVDGVERPEFAVNKIGQLYAALPRMYPRVKAVHWLSMDTIRHAIGSRRLNDFSLLSNNEVAEAYARATASDYFLGQFSEDLSGSGVQIVPLRNGDAVDGPVTLSAYVRTYEQRPVVTWTIAGRRYSAEKAPGAYTVSIDPGTLPKGAQPVVLEVRDSRGKVAGRQKLTIQVE